MRNSLNCMSAMSQPLPIEWKDGAVFGAAEEALRATACQELLEAVEQPFDEIGFPCFGSYETIFGSEAVMLKGLCVRPNQPWHAFYQSKRMLRSDPRLRRAMTSTEPYFCSEALAGVELSSAEQAVLDAMKAFGIAESLICPLHTPDRRLIVAVLSGPDLLRCHAMATPASVLAGVFLRASFRLAQPAPRTETIDIKPRQLECLEWARRGKSSADIGDIIGISPRTVDEHISAACAALGVRTRIQAVSKALETGILPVSMNSLINAPLLSLPLL